MPAEYRNPFFALMAQGNVLASDEFKYPGNAWTDQKGDPVTITFYTMYLHRSEPRWLAGTVIHETQHVFQAFFPSRSIFLMMATPDLPPEVKAYHQAQAVATEALVIRNRDSGGALVFDQWPAIP